MDSEDFYKGNAECIPVSGSTKRASDEYDEYAGKWKRQRRESRLESEDEYSDSNSVKSHDRLRVNMRKNSDELIDNMKIDNCFALNIPCESIPSPLHSCLPGEEPGTEYKIISFHDLSGKIESFGTSISITATGEIDGESTPNVTTPYEESESISPSSDELLSDESLPRSNVTEALSHSRRESTPIDELPIGLNAEPFVREKMNRSFETMRNIRCEITRDIPSTSDDSVESFSKRFNLPEASSYSQREITPVDDPAVDVNADSLSQSIIDPTFDQYEITKDILPSLQDEPLIQFGLPDVLSHEQGECETDDLALDLDADEIRQGRIDRTVKFLGIEPYKIVKDILPTLNDSAFERRSVQFNLPKTPSYTQRELEPVDSSSVGLKADVLNEERIDRSFEPMRNVPCVIPEAASSSDSSIESSSKSFSYTEELCPRRERTPASRFYHESDRILSPLTDFLRDEYPIQSESFESPSNSQEEFGRANEFSAAENFNQNPNRRAFEQKVPYDRPERLLSPMNASLNEKSPLQWSLSETPKHHVTEMTTSSRLPYEIDRNSTPLDEQSSIESDLYEAPSYLQRKFPPVDAFSFRYDVEDVNQNRNGCFFQRKTACKGSAPLDVCSSHESSFQRELHEPQLYREREFMPTNRFSHVTERHSPALIDFSSDKDCTGSEFTQAEDEVISFYDVFGKIKKSGNSFSITVKGKIDN